MPEISNVINVQLLQEGRLAARDNINAVAVVTDELGFLSSTKRTEIYKSLSAVAADFGTASKMYDHASAFFGTQPNPTSAGGYLIAGYWRAVEETIPDTSAILKGAELSEAVVVKTLQSISDGSFDFIVDEVEQVVTGLNFQTVSELSDVVTVIDNALTGATATLDNIGIVISSNTEGASSTLGYLSTGEEGTDISVLLGLSVGSGALLTQGADTATIAAESKLDACVAIKAETNNKGLVFIDQPASAEAIAQAQWAQASGTLIYDVFSNADDLTINPSNTPWQIQLAGLSNYRMLYSKSGNRKFATAYMARAHVVNFRAENSALTMHLKELPIVPEIFTEGEVLAAKKIGLDIYTVIKDVPIILTADANDFSDNRYNLIAYKDALETDTFNLLKQTSTKVAQTGKGHNQLLDQLEKTTRGFRRAGVFAPGTWSSPDRFGDVDTFNQNIEKEGFYFIYGPLSEQDQADRAARNSTVFQGAVKFAGAIHHADVIVNLNL